MAENLERKRSGGKHFSISEVHRGALMRLVEELKELYPEKKVNASSTLEWMIEKICGKSDLELAEYIALRNKLNKIGGTK